MAFLAAPFAVRLTPPVPQLLVMIGSGGPSYTKCNMYKESSFSVLFATKYVAVSVGAVNDLPLHTKGRLVVTKLSLLLVIFLVVITIGAVLIPYWLAAIIE